MRKQVFSYLKKKVMSEPNNKGSEKSRHADTIIRNHVIWSMGAGLIPVLIADIFAVSALQLDMIRQLCRVYDVNFSETQGKAIVTSLTSSTLARVGAGSLIKLLPGVGSLLGGATVSVFAGASTYALGEVFKKHFASGGTILDFDPARLKKMYQEKFEKGKKVAKEWGKEARKGENVKPNPDLSKSPKAEKTADPKPPTDVIARLKELGELKDSGIITEEEFTQMKKRLLEEL
jgi:uncharacterized protein (DUF697 family)